MCIYRERDICICFTPFEKSDPDRVKPITVQDASTDSFLQMYNDDNNNTNTNTNTIYTCGYAII